MNVGDQIVLRPSMEAKSGIERCARQKCTVVYVHPNGRFFVAEFRSAVGETFRETFYPETRLGPRYNDIIKRRDKKKAA